MISKRDLWYMLDVIDQLTWDKEAKKYTDKGIAKVESYELEETMGFDKVKIRLLLSELNRRKLISCAVKFTGSNRGWFATPSGHNVARYKRGMKK
jgi:transcription initiation factor IIE alpha subunit